MHEWNCIVYFSIIFGNDYMQLNCNSVVIAVALTCTLSLSKWIAFIVTSSIITIIWSQKMDEPEGQFVLILLIWHSAKFQHPYKDENHSARMSKICSASWNKINIGFLYGLYNTKWTNFSHSISILEE